MATRRKATIRAVFAMAALLFISGSTGLYMMLRPAAHMRAGHAAARQVDRGRITTLAELERRFGSPYSRSFSGWDYAFHLGDDDSYFAIDSSWLVVRTDPVSNRVIEAEVIVD